MTILVWLLGVWIGISLVVGGSWMLLVDHWRRKTARRSLPGSAHPPGSVKAREEPGSTPLKLVP